MIMWEALIKLVEKWACCHDWETYHITNVYENDSDKIPWKVEHTLICQKCGKIKKVKL